MLRRMAWWAGCWAIPLYSPWKWSRPVCNARARPNPMARRANCPEPFAWIRRLALRKLHEVVRFFIDLALSAGRGALVVDGFERVQYATTVGTAAIAGGKRAGPAPGLDGQERRCRGRPAAAPGPDGAATSADARSNQSWYGQKHGQGQPGGKPLGQPAGAVEFRRRRYPGGGPCLVAFHRPAVPGGPTGQGHPDPGLRGRGAGPSRL